MIKKFNFPPKLLQLVEYLHSTVGFSGSGEVDVPTLRKLCAEMESEYDAELKAELIPSRELIDILRAERAELIEALRPFAAIPTISGFLFGREEYASIVSNKHLDRARALLERLGAVIRD